MKLVKYLCIVALALGAIALLLTAKAQDAFVGSWMLDSASSTAATPETLPTAGTLEIKDAGGGKYTSVSEATVAGVSGRSEVTFAIDGKDYTATSTPVPPGAPTVTQAVERVSDTVYKLSVKVDGDLIATALNEISNDGKTLTQTTTGIGQFAILSSKTVFRRK
jgi:hypothetical protein